MKHKHAEVLNAIAEGKVVQWMDSERGVWNDAGFKPYTPLTNDELYWRIKPEPKADVVRYIGCFNFGNTFGDSAEDYHSIRFWDNKLKLTFDGESGKLMNAEVL